MTIVGIDPGKNGGLAILEGGGRVRLFEMPWSGTEVDPVHLHLILEQLLTPIHVFLEKVHSMPGQGVASTFSFGMSYGIIKGVLGTMGIPFSLIAPQTWKATVLRDSTKDKAAAIDYCRHRWPHVSLIVGSRRTHHDGLADALCIAAYGEIVITRRGYDSK